MDTRVHYILNGCYTATLDSRDHQPQWTCVLGVRSTDPPSKLALFRKRTATPSEADIAALKGWVYKLAPAFAELLDANNADGGGGYGQEELKRYFGRRSFRGAVVCCSRLNIGEWIALLGYV